MLYPSTFWDASVLSHKNKNLPAWDTENSLIPNLLLRHHFQRKCQDRVVMWHRGNYTIPSAWVWCWNWPASVDVILGLLRNDEAEGWINFFFCALGANLKNQTFICYTLHPPKLTWSLGSLSSIRMPWFCPEKLPPYSTNTSTTCDKILCESPSLHLSKCKPI